MNTWSKVYFGIFFSVFSFLIVVLSFDFDKKLLPWLTRNNISKMCYFLSHVKN